MRGELKERMSLLAQESEKRRRLAELRRDTLRKAEFLKRKAVIDPHDVYRLIKGFFRAFLGRDEELTIVELREALKQVYISNATRQELGLIFEKLHRIEYADVAFPHRELVAILDSFVQTVQQLVRMHAGKSHLLARIKAFLFKGEPQTETLIAELPVVEAPDPVRMRLLVLVERCYAALDGRRLGKAKACYGELLDAYASLPVKDRERNYPLIDQTYRDLMNRAK